MIDKNNNNDSNLEREERWKTYQPKSCVYNNRNKDNSPKTLTHQRKIGISSYD